MVSIKIKFRMPTGADHEDKEYYQIIHDRQQRQLFTDYHIFPSEWDGSRSMVISKEKGERRAFIISIRERIRWDVERLKTLIQKHANEGISYNVDDLINEFNSYVNLYSLFNFMENQIVILKINCKVRT